MIIENPVGKRYAEAFVEYLREERADLTPILNELKLLKEIYDKDPALRTLANLPTLSVKFKEELFDIAFRNFSEHIRRLLKLLIRKHRESLIGDVVTYSLKLLTNAVEVKIILSTPSEKVINFLSEELRRTLNREVIVYSEVDPTLLGGFLILFEDEMLDASLKTKVEKIFNTLKETNWLEISSQEAL